MPRVAAELGPPVWPASTRALPCISGFGPTTTVLVVWLQAAGAAAIKRQTTTATCARVPKVPSSKEVGPNVVFVAMASVVAPVQIGLIEPLRAREGRLPWLDRHLARLHASIAALGAAAPPDGLIDLIRFAAGSGDRVVRVQVTG